MSVSFSDIAQLGINDTPDQLDWDQYQDAKAIQGPPDEGIYTVQAPDVILFDTWEKDGKAHLRIAGETKALVITDEKGKDYKLFFPFISTRKYAKKMGSAFGDYLRAFGILAQPQTYEEYAQLAQATAGRFAKVSTRWEGYCKPCGETVIEGQANFAGNTSAKCPHCNNTVYANLRIARFLSQAQ